MRIRIGQAVAFSTNRIKYGDLLLVAGLCMAPMTSLRIWKIGPGEVLCLLWGIRNGVSYYLSKSDILLFFTSFVFCLLIGSAIGYYLAPNELRVTDIITWIYLAVIAISLYEGLNSRSYEYNDLLLHTFARIAAIWFIFLYIYSITVSRRIFGIPLWASRTRFSGGATNPHQTAILFCGIFFVFIREIVKKKRVFSNLCYSFISLFLMLRTRSSTGVLAIAFGIVITTYFIIGYAFHKHKFAALVGITVLYLIVGLVGYRILYKLFMYWVESDANGLGRLTIFSSFSITFIKSPLLGLGPGVHGINGLIEYHNTYLEILAATGLVGGLVFAIYTIRLVKTILYADWTLLPIVISLYAYGLAGFSMRRLVYWGIVAFITVIAEKRIKKTFVNAGN